VVTGNCITACMCWRAQQFALTLGVQGPANLTKNTDPKHHVYKPKPKLHCKMSVFIVPVDLEARNR